MKTDELVAMLAAGATPIEPKATSRRFHAALGWGLSGATLLMAILLGVRSDLNEAVWLPMFWIKLGFPLAVAAIALLIAQRLARPGMRLGRWPASLAGLFAVIWLLGLISVLTAAPAERDYLIYGDSWDSCPFNIALLSIPVFIAAMWAMKGLAPTRLSLAGAASGLLAGAVGAAVYALHCPELQAPFIGIWYVLGMMIPTAAGLLLGRQLLRW